MRYVAIYDLGNLRSAFCFDTYKSAVSYINSCSKFANQYKINMAAIDNNYFEMILMNGRHMYIHIEEFPDNKVRFDLSFEENGKHVETRRFTKRHLAVDYAHKFLKEKHNYSACKKENELGEWLIENPKSKYKTRIKLSLVIIDEVKMSGPEYDILGVEPTSSLGKVKRAYRRQAIKYHPDKGGDPEMFMLIHEAYERIMNGRAAKPGVKQVVKTFSSTDMRFVFKNFNAMHNRLNSILSTKSDAFFRQMRKRGARMSICGLLLLTIDTIFAIEVNNIPSFVKNIIIFIIFVVGYVFVARGVSQFVDSKRYLDGSI